MKRWTVLKASYAFFFLITVGLFYFGRTYYLAPSIKKVRMPLHPIFRQSGSVGHLLGGIGAFFMILLLIYSLRKRVRFMRNWGNLNNWLEAHIFLGLSGPILVLFHTTFKFSGIVAISFWSMVLVVISGIVGRFIYQSIPHSISGIELNRIEMEAEEIGITYELRKWLPRGHPFWAVLDEIEKRAGHFPRHGLFFLFGNSLKLRHRLSRALKKVEILDYRKRRKFLKLILKRQKLIKRKQFLDRTLKILHYWHILHIPFVILMFIILLIHVYVTYSMGYKWIF